MGIINTLSGTTFEGIDQIVGKILQLKNNSGVSLPQYTSKTLIASRAFVDENIAEDPITPDVLNVVHQLYCAYVLTALQLDQMVQGVKVDELLNVVATENFNSVETGIENLFQTSNSTDIKLSNANKPTTNNKSVNTNTQLNPNNNKTKEKTDIKNQNLIDFNENFEKLDIKLPYGKIMEIVFGSGQTTLKVNILVQLLPTIISSAVADAFLNLNFSPSVSQRWFQWKAGEIEFFKDFLFARDLRAKRKKALIEDTDGVLYEMLQAQDNALSKTYLKYYANLADVKAFKNKQNIANTVLVFDKQNLTRASSTVGINLDNLSDRERFFARTFAMIVVVIDNLQNFVTMYFHGIKNKAVYTYNQIRYNSKGNKMDTMGVLEAYAKGLIPKL